MATLHLHRVKCGSWACPVCSRRLGRVLLERLSKASETIAGKGEKFIMASLTVDRAKFESAGAAFQALRRGAVREAVLSWWRARGLEGDARWLTKLELQEAGWPHWHVLIIVPVDLKIRLPYAPAGKKGEFDDHWSHGFSNVTRSGNFLDYASKSAFAGYVCKEAGPTGAMDALRSSGLPGSGVHFISPSHGFWEYCGVKPPTAADAREFPDEFVEDEPASLPPCEPPTCDAALADRVGGCGLSSVITVEGGMSDESREVGNRSGTFGIRVPYRRGDVGRFMEDYFGSDGCRFFEYEDPSRMPDVVEYVPNVQAADVAKFVEFLFFRAGDEASPELLASVDRRMGLCPRLLTPALPWGRATAPPDESRCGHTPAGANVGSCLPG